MTIHLVLQQTAIHPLLFSFFLFSCLVLYFLLADITMTMYSSAKGGEGKAREKKRKKIREKRETRRKEKKREVRKKEKRRGKEKKEKREKWV